ncbi:MAG: glutamate synthase subunit beta [Saprospiraceae bacterium]|nr:glutamate synthase subunit beta [Saprospiraceae bacterium]
MADIHGFKNYSRSLPEMEDPKSRVEHFKEFSLESSIGHTKNQASRCMDCGVPFCHNGCPLENKIPDFNDAIHKEQWRKAYEILKSTNNFPEFTGRVCPAPCEAACVLGINSDPVAIEYIEKSIIEKAFSEGWVEPNIPSFRTGKNVAIIGSGPAGLACADQLNQAGHLVTIYEKADRIGGLLRYGIPDFKLDKKVLDRRITLLEAEGINFKLNQNVGVDISPAMLLKKNDAVVLCGGAMVPRDLPIEGRNLEGIHFAMKFLTESNKRVAGDQVSGINVEGKNVIVIGGGDTGSDCIGTSRRLGAKSILQIELLSKPPNQRSEDNPWPLWPMILRTSSSQEEGCEREWSILSKRFLSTDGTKVSGLEIVKVKWDKGADGRYIMTEIPGSEEIIPCDVVFLAIGFTNPLLEGSFSELPIALDSNNNVHAHDYKTSIPRLFVAGDMRRGQSLVVWAISEGREAAREIDLFLEGEESLLVSKTRNELAV